MTTSSPFFTKSVARDAKENREKKMAARTPGGKEDFTPPFFPSRFICGLARRAKRRKGGLLVHINGSIPFERTVEITTETS